MKTLLTYQDLAARWQCTVRTIHALRRRFPSKLPAIVLTEKHSVRFDPEDVCRFENWRRERRAAR